jgi:hypothetical protein
VTIIAHLNDTAFQSLLISSIETFPSAYIGNKDKKGKSTKSSKSSKAKKYEGESFGLLFGQRMMKEDDVIFNVTLAVPMQATKRKKDMVHFSRQHFSRIREVTESFPYLEFLGTFHSHPCRKDQYNARHISEFSDIDEACALDIAKEYGDEILEVILGITALDLHSKRPALTDGETIQSYCGRFKYSLSAYYTYGVDSDDPDDYVEYIEEDDDDEEVEPEDSEMEDSEWFDDDEEEEDSDDDDDDEFERGLMPVDRLICPLAAHGGDIFNRTDIQG